MDATLYFRFLVFDADDDGELRRVESGLIFL